LTGRAAVAGAARRPGAGARRGSRPCRATHPWRGTGFAKRRKNLPRGNSQHSFLRDWAPKSRPFGVYVSSSSSSFSSSIFPRTRTRTRRRNYFERNSGPACLFNSGRPKFLFAVASRFLLHWQKFFTAPKPDDSSLQFDETLRGPHGGERHLVRGRARRNRRPARPERRREEHDDADFVLLHAGDERHGARGGLRRVSSIGGGAPPHRLHAGKQSAVSRNARARVSEISRAAQGPRLAALARARHDGDGAMRPGGRGPSRHRPALERLPPARRPGGRA